MSSPFADFLEAAEASISKLKACGARLDAADAAGATLGNNEVTRVRARAPPPPPPAAAAPRSLALHAAPSPRPPPARSLCATRRA
jgi:hypothetical protein